jgi:hypothetical protein
VTSRRFALLLLAALVAAAVAVPAAGSVPPTIKRAVLIVINGKGKVVSLPNGIACPKTCRGFFPKDSRVHLVAKPASGWRVARWKGDCTSKTTRCAFWLTTDHECSAQLCKVGAFGVRVYFVRKPPAP